MIKIAIADTNQFVHDSLELFCKNSDGNKCIVFNAFGPDEIKQKLSTTDVDVLIIDVNLPLAKGLTTCKEIRASYPHLKILAFSLLEDAFLVGELFKAGINCYLKKSEGFETLKLAINELIRVGYYYRYDLGEILTGSTKPRKETSRFMMPNFSDKEMAIIKLVRQELTTKQIAAHLNIHIKTVEFHKHNMIIKTGCKRIVKVVDYMISNNMLPKSSD